ncbi:MAG: hypothetical protein PHE43_04705 [Candidatus Nanoarchaeia archaeon]|nr:hypothetical protein [Candidatus Nanoarchaeia archaeon]
MTICTFCKKEVDLDKLKRDGKGMAFLKKEVMFICPHCGCVLGFAKRKPIIT